VDLSLRHRLLRVRRATPLFLMMLPGLIYLMINNYMPLGYMWLAFKKINFVKGLWGSDWYGLNNFTYLFRTNNAWIITRNTIGYNICFILANMVFPIAFAIMLNSIRYNRSKQFFQTVILIPYLLSMVIVGYLVYGFLADDTGFVNNYIVGLLGQHPVKWYSTPSAWVWVLNVVNVWKASGYYTIIYLAAIIGVSPEYYEAADIDGATTLQKVFHVTLPSISGVIITLTLLQVGKILYSDFGMFYQVTMNTGALLPTTNVIDTYVYRALLQIGDIGMSAAACVYQSVVGFLIILVANYIVRKTSPENAMF
jgi:putative aldouronate transport system permease protein